MKTVYISEKRKLTARKIKRIAKKIDKIGRTENIAVAISNDLRENKELLEELESRNFMILNR